MKLTFQIIFIILFLLICFGCRQIFGDRTQTDSIIEPTEVNSILITQPEYGSEFKQGDGININWVSSGEISSVDIILYKKNELIMKIAEAVPNNKEFYWRIPVSLKSSVHYLIYVLNHYNHDEFDISDRFIIQN